MSLFGTTYLNLNHSTNGRCLFQTFEEGSGRLYCDYIENLP